MLPATVATRSHGSNREFIHFFLIVAVEKNFIAEKGEWTAKTKKKKKTKTQKTEPSRRPAKMLNPTNVIIIVLSLGE